MSYLLRINLFFLLCIFIRTNEIPIVDNQPLVTVTYAQRNITLYTSMSNPSREPNTWIFWYDPLIVFDASKDIYQFNEQVRLQFSIASAEFDDIARKTIMSLMHPDVQKFGLSWNIEPLPIDTLTIYIIDQTLLPIPSIYPCIKTQLSGILTFECQFLSSSMMKANAITQQILCGKFQFQFEYYVKPLIVPPRIATIKNLHSLRANFGLQKYIHPRQAKKFLGEYLVQSQLIDETIKDADLQLLFDTAMNSTTRYDVNDFNEIWSLEDLNRIINQDLFYMSINRRQQLFFHLKNTDSPWALKSMGKQKFTLEEIQQMFAEQIQLNVEWLVNENRWKIRSLIVRSLSDLLDYVQLILINQQYQLDRANATHHRTIDCSSWSTKCVCQSSFGAIVFTSTAQFLRIPDVDFDFLSTGLTIELWIRPDSLPIGNQPVQLMDFRGEFRLIYQRRGEITFVVIDSTRLDLYVTSLQTLPLNQWTFISCVYSMIDNQLQLYLNGEFVSSIILPIQPKKTTNEIIIGQEFLGAVRDLRLWRCARTAEEILFTTKVTSLFGNETCLVGLWPMAEAVGQVILDVSVNGPPHPGTLGFDDNPNLHTDPIWVYVLPKPPEPPQPRVLTWHVFRENITFPMTARWGTVYDAGVPTDYDGDGFGDFSVYRSVTSTWIVSPSTIGLPGDLPAPGNYDGDRYGDFSVFRPSTAQWIIHLSSNPAFQYIHQWGKPGDVPCPGDYDGDGKGDFVVYRKGIFYINPSTDPSVQWTKVWGQPGDRCVPNCDFDGDKISDFTVWTPSSAIWSWIPSSTPWLIYQKHWGGSPEDRALCSDFDGDGKRDFVIFRNWTGDWFILPYRVSSFLITFQWGTPLDLPVAGDYDGDGRAEFGLWRPRVNRTFVWEIIPSVLTVALIRKGWGIAGDVPVIGDFNGDKKSEFTVFRPSNGFWYILFIAKPGIQMIKHWGFTVNDTAVAGDWDGDLITDFTIYRPSTGYWYIMLGKNPILQIFMQWGVPRYNDQAVPGDFDGDGKFDFAVWRPSTGMWFILPSSNPSQIVMTQWGIEGDIPVTGADFDGDGKTDIAVWRPSTGSWYILPSTNPIYPFFGPFVLRQPSITPPPPLPPVPTIGAAPG